MAFIIVGIAPWFRQQPDESRAIFQGGHSVDPYRQPRILYATSAEGAALAAKCLSASPTVVRFLPHDDDFVGVSALATADHESSPLLVSQRRVSFNLFLSLCSPGDKYSVSHGVKGLGSR
jgi:hypothetical protein